MSPPFQCQRRRRPGAETIGPRLHVAVAAALECSQRLAEDDVVDLDDAGGDAVGGIQEGVEIGFRFLAPAWRDELAVRWAGSSEETPIAPELWSRVV